MRFASLALAVAASLTLAGCTRAAEDASFGQKVRAYLLEHPEVIEEAAAKLQEKRQSETAAKIKLALQSNRQAIERDPRDFVANPAGRITVTEFYDYRCSYCIRAAPEILDLIRQNPDVRFVFKEMPIFGDVSERAARLAIAVKGAGGDYLGLYREMMQTKGLDAAAIERISRNKGVDLVKAEAGAARTAADAHIADVHKLARELGIEGTPTFIVGDVLIPGADMEALQAAIAKARTDAKAS